jgi:hypothetical protein
MGVFSGACLVAAYHGGGRHDYATSANGFWVEPGDSFGLVGRVAAALRCPPETAAAMTAAGQAAATRREQERLGLIEFWRSLLPDLA